MARNILAGIGTLYICLWIVAGLGDVIQATATDLAELLERED